MFYKVVTPLSFLSKQDTRNLNSSTTQTSNTNNLQSYNKSANINNNNEQKNEIIVKSIKILAVTEDEVNDYSSESDTNSLNSIQTNNTSAKLDNSINMTNNNNNNKNNNKNILKSKTSSCSSQESEAHHNDTIMKVCPVLVIQEPGEYEDHSVIEIKNEIESEDTEEIEKDSEEAIDLSIFELLDKNSKKFILKPATMGLTLKCQIFRQKGIYPQYKFYLENLEGQLLLIMTARKKKRTKTTCYVINYISYDESDVEKYIETPIAKLKSNLIGTQFTLYDFGIKPGRSGDGFASNLSTGGTSNNEENFFEETTNSSRNDDLKYLRKEYLSVEYDFNIFGYKGPRQMSIIIPGMDNEFQREEFYIRNESDSILGAWRSLEMNLQRQKSPAVESKKSSRLSIKARSSSKHAANSSENQSKSECEGDSEDTASKQGTLNKLTKM